MIKLHMCGKLIMNKLEGTTRSILQSQQAAFEDQ